MSAASPSASGMPAPTRVESCRVAMTISVWTPRLEPGSEMAVRGWSRVHQAAAVTDSEPPQAGRWAARGSYYRIDLRDYEAFHRPLPLSVLLSLR